MLSRTPGFAVALASDEFFPNQLGQPTQQQLQELIRNWGTISDIILKSSDTAVEWGDAVGASSQRASVAIERLGIAFSGFFAALGGNEDFVALLNRIAAGVQNVATESAGGQSGLYQTAGLPLENWSAKLGKTIADAVIKGGGNIPTEFSLDKGLSKQNYFENIFKTAQLPEKLILDKYYSSLKALYLSFLSQTALTPIKA